MVKDIDINDRSEIIAGVKGIDRSGLPPVHLWDPPFCGDIDMVIKSDGSWWHEGRQIKRSSMVRMFSSLLRKEGDRHFLVTPVEKVGIDVEQYPFLVSDMEVVEGARIYFTTTTDDKVLAGKEGCRIFLDDNIPPRPVVSIRMGLYALVCRSVYYRLMELVVQERAGFGVWSNGEFFSFEET
ncbi:MAG: DUF1285 domain-containing protein [Gammaproteobacteria bacterium]|nr:DUF1285 domain-containing protein [Gammaproteobacteria bacterium]